MFQRGDVVRIRPEWRDRPEEREITYMVADVNEVTKLCIILALDTGMSIAPSEVVSFEMIEKKEEGNESLF